MLSMVNIMDNDETIQSGGGVDQREALDLEEKCGCAEVDFVYKRVH